jgi:hypothetical protein
MDSTPTSHDFLAPGAHAAIEGVQSRSDLNGRLAKIISCDEDAGRYAVEVKGHSPLRLKTTCCVAIEDVVARHAAGFDILGGVRCVWCRAPAGMEEWACACQASFCSEVCQYMAHKHGHTFLCKKGLASVEWQPGKRYIVNTLPRATGVATVDTARIYFKRGGDELHPGAGLVCAHVAAATNSAVPFKTFRFAIKFNVAAPAPDIGVDALLGLFNEMVKSTLAMRDAISPPARRRDNPNSIPRRTLSVTIVAADRTVEHVEVAYESPQATSNGVCEHTSIDGSVYARGLGGLLPNRLPTLLTPARIHAVVFGTQSVAIESVLNPPMEPAGAQVGGIAVLLSSEPSLTNAVRLESYNAPRGEWVVKPVRWDNSAGDWQDHKKKPTHTVPVADVCVEYVYVPGMPRLWRTVWKPGSKAEDVALMAYCTLSMQKRAAHGITICEAGNCRPFELPREGTVVFPTPPAPFRVAELRDELRKHGMTDVYVNVLAQPQQSQRAGPAHEMDAITILGYVLPLLEEVDARPEASATLIERTTDNATIFHMIQTVLSQGESAFQQGSTIMSAPWIAFRGGGGKGPGESMWVAGRPGHSIDAARRMIMEISEERECAICLDPLIDGPSRPLRCGHVFHLECMYDIARSEQPQQCALCKADYRMTFAGSAYTELKSVEDIDEMDASRAWLLQELRLS